MLAEKKSKTKYSLNPNGTAWSNDSSKLGQRLIEKMGWSKGKGLGKKEDGRTEHVKVECKSDKRGVGCSLAKADQLSSHQDDFQAVLANLASIHNNDMTEDVNKDEQKLKANFSNLSETAKSSYTKSRYHKFIQSKNLSLKSEQDMKCVFGIKKINKKEDTLSHELGDDKSQTVTSLRKSKSCGADLSKLDDEVILEASFKTIQSSSNISDYFALKMAKLKAAKENSIEEDEKNINNETSDNEDNSLEDYQGKSPIEKKKKSKKNRDDDKVKFVIANNNEDDDININEGEKRNEKNIKCEEVSTQKVSKVKKKKKNKNNKDEKEESLIIENEKELPKKKKNKVKKAKTDDECIHVMEQKEKIVKKKKLIENHSDDDDDAELKKNKKRKISKAEI